MGTSQILEHLKKFKLAGMAKSLEEQAQQPNTYLQLSFEDRLSIMLEREAINRENSRLKRLMNQAKFKICASVENIDFQHKRGLAQKDIASLLNSDWLNRFQNLLITGPTGCGKTYLACAIGHYVCTKGISARYYRANRLMEALTISHGDGTYSRLIKAIANTKLLIIDDWGLQPLTASQRTDLLEIMEDRHNNSSTIITSQIPTSKWHETIGEPTLADAILDRIIHNAYKFSLKGESMRKVNTLTQTDHSV